MNGVVENRFDAQMNERGQRFERHVRIVGREHLGLAQVNEVLRCVETDEHRPMNLVQQAGDDLVQRLARLRVDRFVKALSDGSIFVRDAAEEFQALFDRMLVAETRARERERSVSITRHVCSSSVKMQMLDEDWPRFTLTFFGARQRLNQPM